MLNKLKKFSKSKLGAVVVFIVALPFVFFGMGSVFQNKDTNNIAKIDNYNISTKNFTNHISSLGISPEVIRNNLDQNILEEILSDLLAKKFIELEINYYDLLISDEQLVKIIKKNKNFLDQNSKFDRIKYEKFLIENNLNASDFENFITLFNVFKDFKFPYIFQLAMKYIILFVIILFLIYRFVFIDQ